MIAELELLAPFRILPAIGDLDRHVAVDHGVGAAQEAHLHRLATDEPGAPGSLGGHGVIDEVGEPDHQRDAGDDQNAARHAGTPLADAVFTRALFRQFDTRHLLLHTVTTPAMARA